MLFPGAEGASSLPGDSFDLLSRHPHGGVDEGSLRGVPVDGDLPLPKRRLHHQREVIADSGAGLPLPTFGGSTIGSHPAVTRLMKGVFNGRPPTRLVEAWDVSAVFPAAPTDFVSAQR